jgi:membrane fusion protein (multidrug efflux system)
VQRVPVRISLSPEDLAQHPLRVGLSMEVKVEVRDQSGSALAQTPRTEPVAQTAVYDAGMPQAEERIARLIAGQSLPALTQLPEPAALQAAAQAAAAPTSQAAQ